VAGSRAPGRDRDLDHAHSRRGRAPGGADRHHPSRTAAGGGNAGGASRAFGHAGFIAGRRVPRTRRSRGAVSLFTPGSIPWLILNELRLMLRGWIRRPRLTIILGLFAVVFMTTFVGLPVAYELKDISDLESPMILLTIDLMLAVQFTLLLS